MLPSSPVRSTSPVPVRLPIGPRGTCGTATTPSARPLSAGRTCASSSPRAAEPGGSPNRAHSAARDRGEVVAETGQRVDDPLDGGDGLAAVTTPVVQQHYGA